MTVTPVAPGQVWMDNDPRLVAGRRFLEVVAVGATHATVRSFRTHVTADRKIHKVYGRTTRIRLDRFRTTSTGYRHVS